MDKPNYTDLAALEQAISRKKLPPVELWNPERTGSIDIVIQRNGNWLHEGEEIARKELIRLFAGILRKDSDAFYLVTPQEKLKIVVEDAPFCAVTLEVLNQGGEEQMLVMDTNAGDRVLISQKNRLWVDEHPVTAEPSPYVHVRHGLNALVSRSVFYELIDLGKVVGHEMVVKSAHEEFSLGNISET